MAVFETPGINGEVIWSDKYKTHVAYYPPECLPSSSTEYFSSFAWEPATNPYMSALALGGTPLGMAVVAGLFPFGVIGGDVVKWTTKHKHIFAQCEFRINEPIIITQEMIDKNEIELPNHIYEMVSVTQEPIELPPIINTFPSYTINVTKYSKEETITIQASLVLDTNVFWTLVDEKNEQFNSAFASIDDSGLITLIPSKASFDAIVLRINATNSFGSDEKTISITALENDTDPKLVVKLPEENVDKDRIETLLWNKMIDNRNNIPNNIFSGVVINKIGIYYRLDNGTDKAIGTAGQTAIMPTYTPWYNDSSSKKLTLTTKISDFNVGDIFYSTYCAVKEHYLRQCVSISWFAIDAGILGFVGYATSINAANFKFYKWQIPGTEDQNDNPNNTKTDVEGWRCVETFGINPELSAIITDNLAVPDFAKFGNDNANSSDPIVYLPTETPFYKINEIINNPNYQLPFYYIQNDASSDGHIYSINKTFPYQGLPLEEIENTWLSKYISEYPDFRYSLAIKHLVFNMHQDALIKRDIDKIALPISLADALSEAINSGESTQFPFYDIPTGLEKWKDISKILDSTNYKIDSIKSTPKIITTANAFSITSPLGLFPGIGSGYLMGEFRSNLIQEQFKKGTKVLVEGKPLSQRGQTILSVKCKGGGTDFVNCVQDKPFNNIFVYSINNDSFLISRKLKYSMVESDLQQAVFKPQEGGINYSELKSSVTISDFPVVGFSGLLGDSPGLFPGKVISFYKYSTNSAFTEYYFGKSLTNINAKKEIVAAFHNDGALIQLGELVYTGSCRIKITSTTTVEFKFSGNKENIEKEYINKKIPDLINNSFKSNLGLMLFLSGNKIESAIDNVPVNTPVLDNYDITFIEGSSTSTDDNKVKLTLDVSQSINETNYYWLKGDSIKIYLPFFSDFKYELEKIDNEADVSDTEFEISLISVIGMQNDYAKDFLSGKSDLEKRKLENDEEDELIEWKGNNFIQTDCATSYIGDKGHLYLFFNDQINGISCAHSPDDGIKWELQYQIIPPIDDEPVRYPFCFRSSMQEQLFLFVILRKALYLMKINLYDFNSEDAFSIQDDPEKFIGTVRKSNLYLVAGNNDEENIAFIQKNKLKMGSMNCFANIPFETPFYSVYQNKNGVLKMFFLDNGGKVQCNYSADGGINWEDLWLCMAEGQDGFIKQIQENLGKEQAAYPYGIEFYKSPDNTKIESPYVFCSPQTDRVYLFFVYKNCLLCKIFFDPINCQFVNGRNNYETFRKSIEDSKSHFIDGNISQIKDELNTTIIMVPQNALDKFSAGREILPQRVCAVETKNGQVKIFYKTSDGGIRSAWFDAHTWCVDDMMAPLNSGESK